MTATSTAERFPYARTVTPSKTYVKHEFALTEGFAEVKRAGVVLHTLTGVHAEFEGLGKYRTGRVVGTNADGNEEIWQVTSNCGCGEIAHVMDTEERFVPR